MSPDIFTLAVPRAKRLGVWNILVATNTGESVRKAQQSFGPEFSFFAVGNHPSSREKGFALHSGIADATKQQLEAKGIKVIRQDASIFQASANRKIRVASFDNAAQAYVRRFAKTFQEGETVPNNICKVMGHILAEFFGDGPKVCMEIALMAVDSGQLPLNEDCMAMATPGGYSHAALVLHPVKTSELFSTHFRVKDLLLVPGENDIWFNDGPIP
ncbi:MAG: hypothetical protein AMK72_03960 [Planctomycetes bacterium SM23_25]|nr:MAG: hypothetical protein AMK72_03960 [Planctomycetes bacterium SM23_25]